MSLGAFTLGAYNGSSDLNISAAGTFICDPITNLIGMQSLTAFLRFAYGSGGSAVKAFLQTSLDGGNSWMDIACLAYAQASRVHALNFSALTPKGLVVPTDGAMADDTVLDGLLGDRVRLKAVVTGTYAGQTALVARMVAH